MKKLMVVALFAMVASCSDPESKVEGHADSTSENDNDKVLNSRPGPTDPGSQGDVQNPDSSASPATDKTNANSPTEGTNRAYGDKGDSSKPKP